MALYDSYKTAEAVAEGFRYFREPLQEYNTEITRLVAQLYSISVSLKGLEDLTRHRAYHHNLPAIQPDLELLRASLKYTLEDVLDFFDDLENRRGDSSGVYKQIWVELCSHFVAESQESLSTRLAKYNSFLGDLNRIMKGEYPDTRLMSSLRSNIKGLLVHQDSRLAPRLGSLSLSSPSSSSSSSSSNADPGSPASDRRPRSRRSYERARPAHSSPQSPISTSSGTFSDIPPSVPDAPDSPTTSTTATSQSVDSTSASDHWARRVFLDEHPKTAIPFVGESSKCLGELREGVNVKAWLHSQGFEELFELAFNGDETDLRVSFYLRDDDNRVRIVCKSRRSRSSDYFCLPLNLLEIVRVGSCLQICRRRRGGSELVLWANLKFGTIEHMVIFFCTFLALRSQDSGRPVERIRDYELDEEEELFGGQIVDDDFLHALRVYRDNVSGAVRLQASVHKGEMKRMPVWTAFITRSIKSRGWIRRLNPKTVVLRDLHRVIFTFPNYNPPMTPKGEHILMFKNRSDAQGFMDTIAELS
ncbi:uncharacterized protein BO80DRAFT_424532 [Aspergillus ibericus CBS 121593]|uniref:Uncharacterized protein n=1 Tax=Aspergillus ibericus CBS 121593 TaxID=1448316 RepID=A0A395H1E0_9EURO|nr:hypothetical protein BO80DRAFT_424532 [Aspergillus ibericus CBS 121593]RAL01701.1 hypothetical protein BO80DRAFT_424532 [Aspergillus ibericus CBS 121593]